MSIWPRFAVSEATPFTTGAGPLPLEMLPIPPGNLAYTWCIAEAERGIVEPSRNGSLGDWHLFGTRLRWLLSRTRPRPNRETNPRCIRT